MFLEARTSQTSLLGSANGSFVCPENGWSDRTIIYRKGTESPSFKVKGSDLKVSMASFIASELGVDSSAIRYHSGHSEDVMTLTHIVQVRNKETNAWYEAFVDAHLGEILSMADFVAQATYTVVPITKVAEGEETLVNPEDFDSSSEGWVQNGETAGNNVIAYKGTQSTTTPESSPDTFDYPYNLTIGPTEGGNLDAIRTNAFYVINKVHNFAYKYGWTEASSNFQTDNFGKGGAHGST
ncbi:Fungalysin metallopeptidase-domain-containing protein [Armillaria borealis]|uniref:Extracellular metalloproteinase n=1 Tax=Armillaria borealis TaxID=47425 RepID=A0AA39JAP0_9AGAR|nr:Fungalysin metallopeptidase-domain-containing protein [Armillaria borealis]